MGRSDTAACEKSEESAYVSKKQTLSTFLVYLPEITFEMLFIFSPFFLIYCYLFVIFLCL